MDKEDKPGPDNELIMRFPIDPNINCLIMVNGGSVLVEDMSLSFNFLPRVFSGTIPGIIVNEGASIEVVNCDIKGNKNYKTIGMILKYCDAIISNTKIHNHKLAGILMLTSPGNKIHITSSKISGNEDMGIQALGPEAAPVIDSNKIEGNKEGVGISVGVANKAKVIILLVGSEENNIPFLVPRF